MGANLKGLQPALTFLGLQSRFWGQTTLISSSLSPKRDCSPQRVKGAPASESSSQLSSDSKTRLPYERVPVPATVGNYLACLFVVILREALADQGRRALREGAECVEGEVENTRAWSFR